MMAHQLEGVEINTVQVGNSTRTRDVATWTCSCGQTGTTSQAYRGEDVGKKAKGNYAAHRRRRAKKEGG